MDRIRKKALVTSTLHFVVTYALTSAVLKLADRKKK